MIKKLTLTSFVLASAMVTGCQSTNQNMSNTRVISTDDGYRQVGGVSWNKEAQSFKGFNDATIPNNKTRMVFLRAEDNRNVDSSVNIGIDDRFQVSLQSGQFSEVMTCTGDHAISLVTTDMHINDLGKQSYIFDTAEQKTQYYFVTFNDNQPTIKQITKQQAIDLLQDAEMQTHQISRVTDICTSSTPLEHSEVGLNKPIVLQVLFDTDKSNVKSSYNSKLSQVASFMQQYKNTTTMLEGHTDSRGSASYNMRLSTARANAVKGVLVNRYGADVNRIATRGYGESRPIATNTTATGRQANRRVVATISNKN